MFIQDIVIKEKRKKARTKETMKDWMQETVNGRSPPKPKPKLTNTLQQANSHFLYSKWPNPWITGLWHSLTWHICSSWDVLHQPGCNQEPLSWLQTSVEHIHELQISGYECEICFLQPLSPTDPTKKNKTFQKQLKIPTFLQTLKTGQWSQRNSNNN